MLKILAKTRFSSQFAIVGKMVIPLQLSKLTVCSFFVWNVKPNVKSVASSHLCPSKQIHASFHVRFHWLCLTKDTNFGIWFYLYNFFIFSSYLLFYCQRCRVLVKLNHCCTCLVNLNGFSILWYTDNIFFISVRLYIIFALLFHNFLYL